MFTGIVTALGTSARSPAGRRQRTCGSTIARPAWPDTEPRSPIGASIACSGCCLTAVELGPDWFAVDASAETLSQDHAWAAGGSARRSIWNARCGVGRRTGRPPRLRPCRRRRRGALGVTGERLDALALPRPRRARPLHRVEGQRRRRRRLADGQRGRGRHLRRQHHPAHRCGHHASARLRPGERGEHRDRHAGPLRRPAGGVPMSSRTC